MLPPCIVWIIPCGILHCQAVCSMSEILLLILVIYTDIRSACTTNESLEKVMLSVMMTDRAKLRISLVWQLA